MNKSNCNRLRLRVSLLPLIVGIICGQAFLTRAASASAVHSLVPGLRVQRLPVDLSNVNNLEYAPDGRLFTVGYDGRVHILKDTDSDGLEDTATLYYDGQGELLAPVGIAIQPEGVYLAVREKIVLLPDADRDGRADRAETVVTGWQRERHNGANRNDASGVVVDGKGNLYFSLGCADYGNGFLVDKEGQSHYSLESERGTILKVSPDRKSREILCTGIRFGICLRFNRHGDLFATDQEGDTWFPGGNPRDELLHIQPGRHYGFPFRHPKYLPNVVDEPFVVGFGPQHQSTCGFRFNESGPGRQAFGPSLWEGDAFVTGFTRGKLWRVPLVKTKHGYVGEPILIASFNTLPTDLTLSPDGAMVVSTHSGRPDWGSGPKGAGVLYKFTYEDAPQPVAAWAENPLEVRIAFDRPIAKEAMQSMTITGGEFVREGDRFEEIRPGYKVVKEQLLSPTHAIKVLHWDLNDEGRTLALRTTPHPWPVFYAVTLDSIAPSAANHGVEVDLSYRLHGVEASWTAAGKSTATWKGWLPHLDPAVARARLTSSAAHARLFKLWKTPGELRLKTKILPLPEPSTIHLSAPAEFHLRGAAQDDSFQGKSTSREIGKEFYTVEIAFKTGTDAKDPELNIFSQTETDPTQRVLPLHRFLPTWAATAIPAQARLDEKSPEMNLTGDPVRGRQLFFSEEAQCSRCHTYDGEGGPVGPDLTLSRERDPAAVWKDIVNPNAAINPDYVSLEITMNNGDSYSGLLQTEGKNGYRVIDSSGQAHGIQREQIQSLRVNSQSLMPEGLAALGEEKMKDLLAFLCGKH